MAAAVLFVVASGQDGFSASKSGFATNGYGDRSPDGYSLMAAIRARTANGIGRARPPRAA